MVTVVKGNLLNAPSQVLTNAVNTVGVMGKGIALEFKKRFPEMFKDYQGRCKRNEVVVGRPYLWEGEHVQILNFPTKRDWRSESKLEDIEAGLQYLAASYQEMGIATLALPALGCGCGGLNWKDVLPLIEKHLGALVDLEVFVYEPFSSVHSKNQSESSDVELDAAATQLVASPAERD